MRQVFFAWAKKADFVPEKVSLAGEKKKSSHKSTIFIQSQKKHPMTTLNKKNYEKSILIMQTEKKREGERERETLFFVRTSILVLY